MSCKGCLSGTGVAIIYTLNMLLMLCGLVVIGAVSYFWFSVQKQLLVNIYIGLSVGIVNFLFPMMIVCGCSRSRCYLLFDNIITILLILAECVFAALYSTESTKQMIINLLNLPEEYWTFLKNNFSIVLIVIGSFVGVQFLKVIFQGIRASELKNTKDENEQLISDVEQPQTSYRERTIKKHQLDKYFDDKN